LYGRENLRGVLGFFLKKNLSKLKNVSQKGGFDNQTLPPPEYAQAYPEGGGLDFSKSFQENIVPTFFIVLFDS